MLKGVDFYTFQRGYIYFLQTRVGIVLHVKDLQLKWHIGSPELYMFLVSHCVAKFTAVNIKMFLLHYRENVQF